MFNKIAKDTVFLIISSVIGRILGVVTGLLTAKVLGPTGFGYLKIINFIPSLTKFGSLGLLAVAQREIPHIRGQNLGKAKEKEVCNVSFSGELIWGCIMSISVIIISLFYDNIIIRYGLWITAGNLIVGTGVRIYTVKFAVDKKFKRISILEFINIFIASLIIFATIHWVGIFSVLSAYLLGNIIILFMMFRLMRLDYSFSLNKAELLRQLKIGLPLAGATIAFGIFAFTQRGLTTIIFGVEVLGYYMLFLFMIESVSTLLNNFTRAITVDLYENLAQIKNHNKARDMVLKPSLMIALIYPTMGAIICLFVPAAIKLLLPQFQEVISILMLILPVMVFESCSHLVRSSMNSAGLNMQVQFMILWIIAAFVFALVVYVYRFDGHPLTILAGARCASSIILFFGGFLFTRSFYSESTTDLLKLICKMLVPLSTVVIILKLINHQHLEVDILSTIYKLLIFIILMLPMFWFYNKILDLDVIFIRLIKICLGRGGK